MSVIMPFRTSDLPRQRGQRRIIKSMLPAFGAVLLFLFSSPLRAIEMTEAEYLLLPEFCRAQGNVSKYFEKYLIAERKRQLESSFGSNYQHFHHYCWALVAISRAYSTSADYNQRRAHALGAVHDMGYVLERATANFVLLPEIYTKLGEAYLLARDDVNAEKSFRKAWELKSDYWPPYVWWAQRLMQLGKTQEALAVAESGRKNAPGVKALENLIAEIRSGKMQKK